MFIQRCSEVHTCLSSDNPLYIVPARRTMTCVYPTLLRSIYVLKSYRNIPTILTYSRAIATVLVSYRTLSTSTIIQRNARNKKNAKKNRSFRSCACFLGTLLTFPKLALFFTAFCFVQKNKNKRKNKGGVNTFDRTCFPQARPYQIEWPSISL